MALIVNAKSYRGRFYEKAKALVLGGTRVGMVWTDGEQSHCHVCNNWFKPPALDPVDKDAWGECPTCKTPFIFAASELALRGGRGH